MRQRERPLRMPDGKLRRPACCRLLMETIAAETGPQGIGSGREHHFRIGYFFPAPVSSIRDFQPLTCRSMKACVSATL